ncbi:DUF883 family protein [Neoroseomonas lacus]|uniref:DUF883 domain-containing protein n=1 Tax=Neoroseomonas lacus TaxID=287609 RepID=A0A917L8N8_9PROT|nr:DUF883 family protein [Neoroseomonas lacus]GGJ45382.1 hypothetical protein GCM10011320_61010 [Neoroseomonas lacus]
MTKTSEGTTEDIAADLASLRQDVARLTESISALLRNEALGAGQRVSDAVDDAKTRFAGTAADVRSRVNAVGGEIEATIERNPMTAMLITFAVGMALGMMTRSRH